MSQTAMSPELRDRATARLAALIRKPKVRNIDNNPCIRMKSGRLYEISTWGTYHPRYKVSIDLGLTIRELGVGLDMDGVLDIILAEEARRETRSA